MIDRIVLRGLRALGTHGQLPEERSRPQPFDVDLVIEADLAPASTTDDLSDTVDYGAVAEAVARVVETEQFRLLEALAGRVAEVVLGDDRVVAVEVSVRKVRPPVAVDLRDVGVTLRRSRG